MFDIKIEVSCEFDIVNVLANARPKRSMYQHLVILSFIFLMRAIPKVLTFGLCLHVLRLYNVHVLCCIDLL